MARTPANPRTVCDHYLVYHWPARKPFSVLHQQGVVLVTRLDEDQRVPSVGGHYGSRVTDVRTDVYKWSHLIFSVESRRDLSDRVVPIWLFSAESQQGMVTRNTKVDPADSLRCRRSSSCHGNTESAY